MTQTQEREATPAAERAEQIASRVGERLGQLAGRATLRVQQAASALREGPEGSGAPESKQEKQTERTKRAEDLVDQLGQRVSHWGMMSNVRVQKATARLREDAEDLWAEAQEKYRAWEGKRG